MSDTAIIEALNRMALHRKRTGNLLSGRVCLACGEPLFGEDLLHARSLAEPPTNLLDAIRYAGVGRA